MENEILNSLSNSEKVIHFMKEESSLKEYFQHMKEFLFVNGVCQDCLEKKVKKINYIYNKNGMDYIKTKENVNSIQDIIQWLEQFGCGSNYRIPIKIFSLKERKEITVNHIMKYGKEISNTFADYHIWIHYEQYSENVLFSKGILENRNINYIFFSIEKNEVEIDTLVYNGLLPLEEIIIQIKQSLENYNNWHRLPNAHLNDCLKEHINCITTPEVSARLFHETIGHMSEKDVYKKYETKIALHKRIGNKHLNAFDIPRGKEIDTNIFYDDVGTKAMEIIIVKNGILTGIMDDGLENKKGYFKNGFLRGSINSSQLQIRMRNLVVRNGKFEFLNLLNNLDRGILIEKVADSYRLDDKVYLQVVRGVVLRDGKKIGRIEKVQLQSEVHEFLNNLNFICNNGKWDSFKKCTKDGGTIYVSAYAPSIQCKMKSNNY